MHESLSWGNYIKGYMETAIKEDEFMVYFQPKYDIQTEKVKGAEALIRWNYKNREILPPSRFIPFFEKDGSIGKIDDIVLDKVCSALARWKEEGREFLFDNRLNLPTLVHYGSNLTVQLNAYVTDEWMKGLFSLNGTSDPTLRRIVPKMYAAIPKKTTAVRRASHHGKTNNAFGGRL